MCNVLVLDTGTQGYITVKSLHKAGHKVFCFTEANITMLMTLGMWI